jgi:hypothetical protein
VAEGGDDGSVPSGNVVAAMKAAGISVTQVGENVVFVKDGVPEGYTFKVRVGRKLLHTLHRKYGVKIEWFYHPEIYCGGTQGVQ